MVLVFQLIRCALNPTLAFVRHGSQVKVLLPFGLVGGYFKGTLSPVSARATGSSHQHLEREENRYIFACGFKGGKQPSAGCAEGCPCWCGGCARLAPGTEWEAVGHTAGVLGATLTSPGRGNSRLSVNAA